MHKDIIYSDLLNVFVDEWKSENIYFRIILVITQPIRYIIAGLILFAVWTYIFTGFGVMLMLMCFIEGPAILGWFILVFDIIILIIYGIATIKDK